MWPSYGFRKEFTISVLAFMTQSAGCGFLYGIKSLRSLKTCSWGVADLGGLMMELLPKFRGLATWKPQRAAVSAACRGGRD